MKKSDFYSEGVAVSLNKLIQSIEKGEIKDLGYIKESLEWYKHERFVHLLVTVFVGLCLVLLLALAGNSICLNMLCAIFLVLEIGYLIHYYKLENGVQYLNRLYLSKICKGNKK